MVNYIDMKKSWIVAVTAFLTLTFAHAQEATPLVSDISVLVTNMNVQLTWKRNTPFALSSATTFRIYRSGEPLTRQTIGEETFVAEQNGIQCIYTETLPDTKPYYYAVIPYVNGVAQSSAVTPSVNATVSPTVGTYPSFERIIPSGIDNFNVITKDNVAIITYTTQHKGNRLHLYRSTKPFDAIESLNGANLVATFIDTGMPYTDTPPAKIRVYYALAEERDVITGTARFVRGKTTSIKDVYTTSAPLSASAQTVTVPARRMPLPELKAQSEETQAQKLNDSLEELLPRTNAVNGTGEKPRMQKYIFPQERENYEGGKTELASIVQTYFAKENWNAAKNALQEYLDFAQIGSNAKNRTRFYLGETNYFLGQKREALLLFLDTREAFPNESALWIDAVLAQ